MLHLTLSSKLVAWQRWEEHSVLKFPVKQLQFGSRLISINGCPEGNVVFRQALKTSSFGDLCQTQTLFDPALPGCRQRESGHISHNPYAPQTRPTVDSVHMAHGTTFCFFQDSAVSRRVWPWTGSKGSWAFCKTPAWGEWPTNPYAFKLRWIEKCVFNPAGSYPWS